MSKLSEDVLNAWREALGPDAVETAEVAREAYARDLSTLGHLAYLSGRHDLGGYRPPDAVVRPADVVGVQAALRLADAAQVPVVPWGAGSGVCGGAVAEQGGLALDLKGLSRIDPPDEESLLVRVEAGVNGQVLEDFLARRGLTLAHWPSSITCSTVGGWLAARGAGQLSTRYGKIEDMVVGLEVVLASGELVRTPVVPRAAAGPDWNQLFVGCEGTLGVIVAATLRLQRIPSQRTFLSFEFPELAPALAAVREGLQLGARPAAVRLYDPLDTLLVARASDAPPVDSEGDARDPGQAEAPLSWSWPLSAVGLGGLTEGLASVVPDFAEWRSRLGSWGERALLARPELANRLSERLPGIGCLLLLTCEGEPELAAAEAAVLERCCRRRGGEPRGPGPAERWWRNRLAVSFKQSGVYEQGAFVDTLEVAAPWSRLLELHAAVRAALAEHALVLAHFSHAYPDGCSIYFTCVALRDEADPAATVRRYRALWADGLAAAVAHGGAVSHHHGIGSLKAEALVQALGPLHDVFRKVKAALDPNGTLNPGKLGL